MTPKDKGTQRTAPSPPVWTDFLRHHLGWMVPEAGPPRETASPPFSDPGAASYGQAAEQAPPGGISDPS